jgi:type II secretory pathway component PulK
VIVAVLIVIVVLSLAAYTFTDLMTAEYRGAAQEREAGQSRAYAVSGIYYATASLADPATLTNLGNPTLAGAFHDPGDGMVVFEDPANPDRSGKFALVAVVPDGNGGFQQSYGAVIDEGGKLNVNALIQIDPTGQVLYAALMKLPNMTGDIAAAIVDWVDSDDNPFQPADGGGSGAESSYYTSLQPGYAAKNGPLNSLDELLLVRGVTPDLLYGNDRNGNGLPDDFDGQQFTRGWVDYLTVYGRELNLDSTGVIREYLNESEVENLPGLYQRLISKIGQEPADFIMAYRLFSSTSTSTSTSTTSSGGGSSGGTTGSSGMSGGMTTPQTGGGNSGGGNSGGGNNGGGNNQQQQQQKTRQADPGELTAAVQKALGATTIQQQGKRPKSILDLQNVQVTLPMPDDAKPGDPTPVYASPLNDPSKLNAILPVLMDRTTVTTNVELIPRLNVNTAPREVLLAIPNLSSTDVDNIVSMRTSQPPGDPATVTGAWLITSGAITADTFKQIEKYVTGQSMIYRVQSIGYARLNGPVARVEAVIDTNRGAPRILYFRDVSELGGLTPPGAQQ